MDINTLLTDSEEVENVRQSLLYAKAVLQMAAYDYAQAALGASNEVVKSVQGAAPVVAVLPHLQEFQTFSDKSRASLQAALQTTGMLLMAEETGDSSIDSLNREVKIDDIDIPTISSLLEGAVNRINLAVPGIPQNSAPGARCNPTVLNQSETKGS